MKRTESAPIDRRTAPQHGVWLTRPRPGVDRLSSAWLIRRFVDPHGTFVFGDPATRPDAIPFDTFDADLGHHGSHCTFETICERFGIADAAVGRIAHIVHDLDLKVERHREPDTATIGRLVEGLRRAHADDTALLDAGIGLFEALYQSATASVAAAETPRTPSRPARGSRAPARRRRKR